MKIYILFISIYFLNNYNFIGQTTTLNYDLILSGKRIGSVKTTKKVESNLTTFISNTDANISFIIKINIKVRMTVVYKNDSLVTSDYKFYKNDKLKEYATVIRKDGIYILNHDGKKSEFHKPIKHSTIVLPFEVPKNNSLYFEEVEGNFKTIKSENFTLFKLINSKNNRKDDYVYKDGIMKKCIIRNSIVDFTMQLTE